MTNPPLIGITAGKHPEQTEHYVVRWDYVRCIELAGGVPVVLAPSGPALHSALLSRLDGLVVTGGVDIAPSLYGEQPHPTVNRTSPERDEFESALLRDSLRRDVPILGICRGMQMLNVVRGGTLLQDIPSMVEPHESHDDRVRPRAGLAHRVRVEPDTRLHFLLGYGEVPVNSFHHQAVLRVGDGLVVSGRAEDGVVEGIELPGARFVVGVQWHPEAFWQEPRFSGLFTGLVAAATGR